MTPSKRSKKSPTPKPDPLPVVRRLTPSEIESLRQDSRDGLARLRQFEGAERRRKEEKLPAIEGLSREMLDMAAAVYGWKDLPFDGFLDCGPEEDAYYKRLAREVYRQLTPSEIEALRQDSREGLQEARRLVAQDRNRQCN
jgi:hypothetical protein